MKLKQINEDQKCPKCKKFTLVRGYGYIDGLQNSVFLTFSDIIHFGGITPDHSYKWNWQCTNCNAKFIEEDLKNANKTNNQKTTREK